MKLLALAAALAAILGFGLVAAQSPESGRPAAATDVIEIEGVVTPPVDGGDSGWGG